MVNPNLRNLKNQLPVDSSLSEYRQELYYQYLLQRYKHLEFKLSDFQLSMYPHNKNQKKKKKRYTQLMMHMATEQKSNLNKILLIFHTYLQVKSYISIFMVRL